MYELLNRIFGEREAVGLVELAFKLGVNPETLRRAVRRGILPAVRVSGCWRVTRDGLEHYLDTSGRAWACRQQTRSYSQADFGASSRRTVDLSYSPTDGEGIPF